MPKRLYPTSIASLVLAAIVLVGAVAAGALFIAAGRKPAAAVPAHPRRIAAATPASASPSPEAIVATDAPPAGSATGSPVATVTTKPAKKAPAAKPARKVARAAAVANPALDAYRGLGSWVDIYDAKALKDPSTTVSDMARHGVRTLFLETGNSKSASNVISNAVREAFIRAAHAHHMRIVAWYLPDMVAPASDYARIAAAIGVRTKDGQRFDSFALDIESNVVHSQAVRNSRLSALTAKIRAVAGPRYPLGAIIPSPVGLAKKGSYWGTFPYATLAKAYDVFVPMSYYTYHGRGAKAAYADTMSNVRIIRAKAGCSTIPIHLIGGIAQSSSSAEVGSFVRAAVASRCLGAGLYGWVGTTSADWRLLKAVRP